MAAYNRICKYCKNSFEAENPRAEYCKEECKRAAQNERYYQRHQAKVIAQNNIRQKVARRKALLSETTDPAERARLKAEIKELQKQK